MCRQAVSVTVPLAKNYAIEHILNSVETIDENDPLTEQEAVNAISLSVSLRC